GTAAGDDVEDDGEAKVEAGSRECSRESRRRLSSLPDSIEPANGRGWSARPGWRVSAREPTYLGGLFNPVGRGGWVVTCWPRHHYQAEHPVRSPNTPWTNNITGIPHLVDAPGPRDHDAGRRAWVPDPEPGTHGSGWPMLRPASSPSARASLDRFRWPST